MRQSEALALDSPFCREVLGTTVRIEANPEIRNITVFRPAEAERQHPGVSPGGGTRKQCGIYCPHWCKISRAY
jgi:hypothetical protein